MKRSLVFGKIYHLDGTNIGKRKMCVKDKKAMSA